MNLPEALDQLERALAEGLYSGYLSRPIPHALDDLPRDLCTTYLGERDEGRGVLGGTDRRIANVLQAYAERLASLAVRDQQPESLRASLVSLGLSMVISNDAREGVLVMSLPWRSAELLHRNPHDLFEGAAAELPDPARTGLRSFAQRAPQDRTLAAMGYQEGSDQDGFRYQRTW